LWGICKEPAEAWREQLKESVNRTGAVMYPLVIHKKRSLKATIACGMNSHFKHRKSYEFGLDYRRPPRDLFYEVPFLLFLDSVPLQSRVLFSSASHVARLAGIDRSSEAGIDSAQI
jgi:hypothetical protein